MSTPGAEYRDQHLDPAVAASYDDAVQERFRPETLEPTVDRLVELAQGGRALEFAVGTGRVALPLAARGVQVHGIDLSPAMVDQLRSKPGGSELPVTIGDMTSTIVDGHFSLVYLVFNTIGNLVTQPAQVACFENAARHLEPGGRFVIETGVPKLPNLGPEQTLLPFALTDSHVGIDEYVDPVNQIQISHHWFIADDRVRRVSGRFRWVWPSELDLMARIAGFELQHRWADWQGTDFTASSHSHVSVWRRS